MLRLTIKTIFGATAVAALFGATGLAQGLTLDAPPAAGYVYNAGTRGLHAITGIPGASMLAATPVITGIEAGGYSRTLDLAIVVKPEGVFAVTGVQSGNLQWQVVAATKTVAIATTDDGGVHHPVASRQQRRPASGSETPLIAWSGTSAMVYAAGGFTRVRQPGSGGGVLAIATLGSVGLPEGAVTSIDFDEAGQLIYAGLRSGDQNGGVYVYSIADGTLQRLLTIPNAVSLAHAGSTVFALDGASATVWSATAGGVSSPLIAALADPSSRVVGIAVSGRGDRIYVADGGLNQVRAYDLSGTLTAQLDAGAAPEKMEPLAGSPLVLLRSASANGPLWLLQDGPRQTGIFFVPALKDQAGSN